MYLSLICRLFIVVDPESDLPTATLAQVLLQEGRPAEALELFDKAVELGRTEQELLSAISYAEVALFCKARMLMGTGNSSTTRCHYKISSSLRKIEGNDCCSTTRWSHRLN